MGNWISRALHSFVACKQLLSQTIKQYEAFLVVMTIDSGICQKWLYFEALLGKICCKCWAGARAMIDGQTDDINMCLKQWKVSLPFLEVDTYF